MSHGPTITVDDLYENAPCGLLLTGPDDTVLSVNGTFLDWTGYTADTVVGADFHLLLESGSQAFYATRYRAELWARDEMREVALKLVRADGSVMPILINSRLVESAEGEQVAVRVAVFDATVRQDYEREMLSAKRQAERSESSVRVLQEASMSFSAVASEEELAGALAAVARQAFDASDSAVVLYGPNAERRFLAGAHLGEALLALNAESGEPAVPESPETVVVSSLAEAFALSETQGEIFRSIRAEALTSTPMMDGDTVVGSFVCFFGRPREFGQAALDLHRALGRQAGLVLARLRLESQLRELAMHDQLTGLANRTLLDERLSHALAVADRNKTPVTLVFIDLDGFKRVNDDLGHRMGDLVLQTVADRMSQVVRDVDVVGRFGGDEFLVVLEQADESAAINVAERLLAVIREHIPEIPAKYSVTGSAGVAVHQPGFSTTPTNDFFVRSADEAMYESKRGGPDRATLVRV